MGTAVLNARKAPRQQRARATCAAILEAAAQLLSEQGLGGYTTNAVAARAGVSIGSLYQYYPNKDALMAALITAQQAAQLARVEQAAAASIGLSLEQTVRALIRAAMSHHVENAMLAAAIDHEEARLPVDQIVTPFLAAGGEVVREVLSRFADELGPIDPQRAARTLPALVRAVVDAWVTPDTSTNDLAEDEATMAVLGYLGCARLGTQEPS